MIKPKARFTLPQKNMYISLLLAAGETKMEVDAKVNENFNLHEYSRISMAQTPLVP